MTFWQWLHENTFTVLGTLLVVFLLIRYRPPSIDSWTAFLDSFESKGGQILLLFCSDLIFAALVIKFNKSIDAAVLATLSGILGGVNGAFLGAMGARQQPSNGNGAKPDQLRASLTPEDQKK